MSSIRPIDMKFLDQLFERPNDRGYVLDFSDRTFSDFFAQELHVDIDEDQYRRNGTSKLNRLRCYLTNVDDTAAVQALRALWEYRETLGPRYHLDGIVKPHARLLDLIHRLEGGKPTPPPAPPPLVADAVKIAQLRQDLIGITQLAPQPRGYAFEKFLKELFDAHRMEAREPFRLRGEQIDGSFQLDNETYLLEAKWQNAATGVADLHGFNGKIEQKAAWTRGLFISQSGFTEDGLHAFGRGKRVVCMDGLDLYETLNRGLPLNEVLARKVRRAAETGLPFIRVRDLYVA